MEQKKAAKHKSEKFKNILPFIFSIISAFFGFGFNFVLARFLGSSVYGDLQYLVSIATTFSSFFVFGLSYFVIREAKNSVHNGQLMDKVFTFFFFLLAFLTPILFYILYNYTTGLENNLNLSLLILAVAIVMSVNTLGASYYQGIGKYHESIFIENILPKLAMFVLTFVFLGFGKLVYFSENYLLYYLVIYGLIAIFILRKFFHKLSLTLTKKEYLSISFFFGVTITYSLTTNLTKIFQGAFFNNSQVLGVISVSLSMLQLLSVVTGVVNNLTKPLYAKLKREGDISGLIDIYRLSTRVNSYVCIPFYIFLITQSENFLLFFGSSYTIYPLILIILTTQSAVNELSGPTGTMLSMTGNEKYELLNGAIKLGVFSICCFIFSYDPIYGLCNALLVSEIIVNLTKYIEVWAIFKRSPMNVKTIFGMLLICLFDFLAIFFLRYISNYWLWFVISLVVGLAVICANFIVGLHKNDFKKIMKIGV